MYDWGKNLGIETYSTAVADDCYRQWSKCLASFNEELYNRNKSCNGELDVKKAERKSTVQTKAAKSRNICGMARKIV